MSLPVANPWFTVETVDEGIVMLTEPHVARLWRANLFLLRGRAFDLLVDTGMGVANLRAAVAGLTDRPIVLFTTHSHLDHMGGHADFAASRSPRLLPSTRSTAQFLVRRDVVVDGRFADEEVRSPSGTDRRDGADADGGGDDCDAGFELGRPAGLRPRPVVGSDDECVPAAGPGAAAAGPIVSGASSPGLTRG